MGCKRDRDRRVDPRQLFDCDRVGERVGAPAAVLLRDRHPHEAELGQLAHELVGKTVLTVELGGNGSNALFSELAHRPPNELVLFGEIEVQNQRAAEGPETPESARVSRAASSTSKRTP